MFREFILASALCTALLPLAAGPAIAAEGDTISLCQAAGHGAENGALDACLSRQAERRAQLEDTSFLTEPETEVSGEIEDIPIILEGPLLAEEKSDLPRQWHF